MNGLMLPLLLGGGLGLVALLLRSKGVFIFLLLCAGFELSTLYCADLTGTIRDFAPDSSLPIGKIVSASLLLLPAVLTLVLSRGQAKKKKLPAHIIGSVAAGWLAVVWLTELLVDVRPTSNILSFLTHWQAAALGTGIVAAVLLVLLDRPRSDGEEGKHKKH